MIRVAFRGCGELRSTSTLPLWRQRYQLDLRTVSTNSAINRILRKAPKEAKTAHGSRFKRSSTPRIALTTLLRRGVVPPRISQSSASQDTEPVGDGRTKSPTASRTKRGEPVRSRGEAFIDELLRRRNTSGRYDSLEVQERRYEGKGPSPVHNGTPGGLWRRRDEEGGSSAKPSLRGQTSNFSRSTMEKLEPAPQRLNHPQPPWFKAEAIRSKERQRWHEEKEGSRAVGIVPNTRASGIMRDSRDGFMGGYRSPRERQTPSMYITPENGNSRPSKESRIPFSIPYTTPASEFLYGKSTTVAALKARQRRLYKLYLHPRSEAAAGNAHYVSLKKLASAADVQVKEVGNDWLPIMDKMSDGRPHNGCILEASPLPRLPINSLLNASAQVSRFELDLAPQSREDLAVNGEDTLIKYDGYGWRYPFLLMLDGIVDPGNLGAIVRSAYFLGVDAIAMVTRFRHVLSAGPSLTLRRIELTLVSAPLSPVAIKASAGAAEATRFFSIEDPRGFAERSVRNGWRFYAAVAPSDKHGSGGNKPIASTELISPLADAPCVLMLGGEGQGLAPHLQNVASHRIAIAGARSKNEVGIDSLNVSVAAALLCDAFLRKPSMGQKERVF